MVSRRRILFLINPKSGVSSKRNVPGLIERHIDHNRFDVSISYTQYAGHAYELAKEAAADGVDVVVAVGGDGTVNEVGRAVVHTGTALGIIPCGSGNGFARHLGIPIGVKGALEFINSAEPMTIDYGKINGHPFFCSCGVGFDATVSNDFAKSTGRGMFNYVRQALLDWVTYQPETYTVETEHLKKKIKAFVIACGNASQYGNNAYITPFASMRDGLLTVSILSPFTALEVPVVSFQLFNHMFADSDYITSLSAPWIRIKRRKPGPAHFDGEPCEMGAELFIEAVPDGIKVLAVPGWDGTCAPVPLYRQFYDVFAGSLPDLPAPSVRKERTTVKKR